MNYLRILFAVAGIVLIIIGATKTESWLHIGLGIVLLVYGGFFVFQLLKRK